MSSPDRYALFGQPVAHSLSPRIHRLFAEQLQQHLSYEALEVGAEQFASAVAKFFADGGRGLNITVPHKLRACEVATRLSARAQRAGAVNTLLLEPGSGALLGENTDGVGLVRDLSLNLKAQVSDRQVLILGAGGATRGILGPLLDLKPAELCIANRSPERAHALAQQFGDDVRAATFDELHGTHWSLILNATSASLEGALPELPAGLIGPGCLCYDLGYGHGATSFMRWADAHGAARSASGLGMLIEQAAESFYLWRGVRPDTAPVRAALVAAQSEL